MIAIPAVDLRAGACVQLVGGDYARERYREEDAAGAVRRWTDCGFRRLHLVDLDAATDRGSNALLLYTLIRNATIQVQAGGGIRNEQQIAEVFDAGARYVILGTRAVDDVAWLEEMAAARPGTFVVAADVIQRRVVTHGWQNRSTRNILDFVSELSAIPLAGLLVTAVHREGLMQGTDLALFDAVVAASSWPVLAAGGISNLTDLRALAGRGVAGAVIGMALYAGAIDPWLAAEEFAL